MTASIDPATAATKRNALLNMLDTGRRACERRLAAPQDGGAA